jgi:hypothetical protein
VFVRFEYEHDRPETAMSIVTSSFRVILVAAAFAAMPFAAEPVAGDTKDPVQLEAERLGQLKKLGARLTFDADKRVVGINLSERKVGDGDLAILAHYPHVEELDLTRTQIRGPGLQAIRDFRRLKKLFLTETQIGDQAVSEFHMLKSIELIGLSGTKITDASFVQLEKMPNLKQLFCLGTKLSPAAIEKLQKTLPECDITGP